MLVTIATARPLVARELAHVLPRAPRAPSESCLLGGGGALVCTRRLPPRGPCGVRKLASVLQAAGPHGPTARTFQRGKPPSLDARDLLGAEGTPPARASQAPRAPL